MLKRIKYVSRFDSPLSSAEIEQIGEQSQANNERLGLTGLLMASGGMFYQVLEGPADAVDQVYAKIQQDSRHTDLLLLSAGVVTALPLVWFVNAAKRLRYATIGFMQYMMPTVTFFVAVFIYHEPFDRAQLLSFCCIWTALVIYSIDTVRGASGRDDVGTCRSVRSVGG